MAYELIYTSLEKGLKPGTRGFCTAAYTKGLTPQNVQLLEALSAYKNVRPMQSGAVEPVAWSHITSSLINRGASVLSRVGSTAPDHTGRSNKLAHHVLLGGMEHAAGGPAWLSSIPGFFREVWNENPRYLPEPKAIPEGDGEYGPAVAWESLTGDPAYAAYLPSLFLAHPGQIAVIVFAPGMEMLPLVKESLALLEPARRWKVTYNTYFTSLPVGATCAWRFCVADSDELREVRRNPRVAVLDLTAKLPPPPDGILARRARDGGKPEIPPLPPELPKNRNSFVLMNNRNVNQLNLKPRKADFKA